jgi:hypothetical protein
LTGFTLPIKLKLELHICERLLIANPLGTIKLSTQSETQEAAVQKYDLI